MLWQVPLEGAMVVATSMVNKTNGWCLCPMTRVKFFSEKTNIFYIAIISRGAAEEGGEATTTLFYMLNGLFVFFSSNSLGVNERPRRIWRNRKPCILDNFLPMLLYYRGSLYSWFYVVKCSLGGLCLKETTTTISHSYIHIVFKPSIKLFPQIGWPLYLIWATPDHDSQNQLEV